VPSSITFSNVIVGQKSSQTVQISNNGKANLNVTGVSLTGAGFSLGSISVPFQLAPGASKNFTVTFSASSATSSKASLTITSDDPASPLMTVAVQGTGEVSSASWQVTPTSLSFANIALQSTQSLPGAIKNTGNVPVTLSSVSVSNPEWSTTGLSTGTTLSPGQQVNFQVTFRPTILGNATGTLKIATSSISSVLTMNLAGNGASAPPPPVQHTVTLTWNPSTSVVSGYHIYRGSVSGGPYSLLNSTLDASTSYVDSSVLSGNEYFYVTTAVDASGVESLFSNEASATVPNP
jgi:hypothetical protein